MCSWCRTRVGADEGFRAYEASGERAATFCRLEHIVPWAIRGPRWEAGATDDPPELDHGQLRCSRCDADLDELDIVLVHVRGEHRIPDAFCSLDHLREWANAGGRWR